MGRLLATDLKYCCWKTSEAYTLTEFHCICWHKVDNFGLVESILCRDHYDYDFGESLRLR